MRAGAAGLLTLVLGTWTCAELTGAGLSLRFPGADRVLPVRLEITIDGQTPEARWTAFLQRLFDDFDRDGNGDLTAAEAARVFPLPLDGRREAKLDFEALDADGDGRASVRELQAFYRRAGFTPVVASVVASTGDDLRASEAFFRHLDCDDNRVLTHAELERAPALLRRLDADEDDVLTVGELLATPLDEDFDSPTSAVSVVADEGAVGAVLQLAIGKEPRRPVLVAPPGDAIQSTVDSAGSLVISVGDGKCRVAAVCGDKPTSLHAARDFCRAQFKIALGQREFVERKQLEQDLALQSLTTLFDYGDRDADGRLTPSELSSLLEVIEQGALCQVSILVSDRGRNLCDALDGDGNGQLDLRELHGATRLLSAEAGRSSLSRQQVPAQYRVTAEPGNPAASFGPLSIPRRPKRNAPVAQQEASGPRWFQVLDANGDAFLSPREFLGPPELFRKFDANGDGSIGVDEAEAG